MHTLLDSPRDCGQYIVSHADTFRRSCRALFQSKQKTQFNNIGGNKQNIESFMRRIWIADKGYKLNQCDQRGADALIVAYLCKAGKYRQLFENDIKPHTYMAMHLVPDFWRKEYNKEKVDIALQTEPKDIRSLEFWDELATLIKSSDKWESSRRYYYMGKKTIHSGSYGMHANRHRMAMLTESGGTIVLSSKTASEQLETFHKQFTEIKSWWSRVLEQALKEHRIYNIFGYPYTITDFIDPKDFKDLIAWAPQSSVAIITENAVTSLYEYIASNNKDWHILQETHDSYLVEAPDNEVEECAHKMKEFMEPEMISPIDGVKFRMKTEVVVGRNWAPRSKNNPEGMEEVKF